ncbi:unnamed protein product [Dibothriocephalus latus]|uniref:Uncharacterized protein n=1 Tax=Dibothriocephalus latus TaxID=60516 RepID=A0A3P6PRX4_DIBLA|nr:unnamed protein product [Dibothriocephalus latus]
MAFGSAGSSAARSDEEQVSPPDPHQFFMDGVVLSETGLNTIRQVMLKGHPKRHLAGGRRASHPCAPSATPDAGSVNDCAPPSVFTPMEDEASQQSAADAEVETISTTYAETKSPSVISEEDASHQLAGSESNSTADRANAAPTSAIPFHISYLFDCLFTHYFALKMSAAKSRDPNAKGKSASANARRQLNLGVGGFRARSTRMYHLGSYVESSVATLNLLDELQ